MRIFVAIIVCLGALYAVDALYCDGFYLHALTSMVQSLLQSD